MAPRLGFHLELLRGPKTTQLSGSECGRVVKNGSAVTRNEILQNDVIALFIALHKKSTKEESLKRMMGWALEQEAPT